MRERIAAASVTIALLGAGCERLAGPLPDPPPPIRFMAQVCGPLGIGLTAGAADAGPD